MRSHDEDILQRQCNAYLDLLKAQGKIKYIHIPGSIQRFVWSKASHVPIHIAKEASDALKGVLDLLIFRHDGMSLKIELKSKTGILTEEQKSWEPFRMQVIRDFDTFKIAVDEFVYYDTFNKQQRGTQCIK